MIGSFLSLILLSAPAAPKSHCLISMEKWCITEFPGKINMIDAGDRRWWTIERQDFPEAGTLIIEESKYCDEAIPATYSLERRDADSFVYVAVNSHGCGLRFRFNVQAEEVFKKGLSTMVLARVDGEWRSLQLR